MCTLTCLFIALEIPAGQLKHCSHKLSIETWCPIQCQADMCSFPKQAAGAISAYWLWWALTGGPIKIFTFLPCMSVTDQPNLQARQQQLPWHTLLPGHVGLACFLYACTLPCMMAGTSGAAASRKPQGFPAYRLPPTVKPTFPRQLCCRTV